MPLALLVVDVGFFGAGGRVFGREGQKESTALFYTIPDSSVDSPLEILRVFSLCCGTALSPQGLRTPRLR